MNEAFKHGFIEGLKIMSLITLGVALAFAPLIVGMLTANLWVVLGEIITVPLGVAIFVGLISMAESEGRL
jgi:hypothetical protein